MHASVSSLINTVYPPICWICNARFVQIGDLSLCPSCLALVSNERFASCPRCASTIGPTEAPAISCAVCAEIPLRFVSTTRLGPYDGLLRDAILKAKQVSYAPLAECLGVILGQRLQAKQGDSARSRWDRVVPVPLHWLRHWYRGYNQSESIAQGLARQLLIPVDQRMLRRVKHTPMQTSLSATERRENVRGAFRASGAAVAKDLRILLVDDVLTTGATADEASRALLEAGAAQVEVAILAHR